MDRFLYYLGEEGVSPFISVLPGKDKPQSSSVLGNLSNKKKKIKKVISYIPSKGFGICICIFIYFTYHRSFKLCFTLFSFIFIF